MQEFGTAGPADRFRTRKLLLEPLLREKCMNLKLKLMAAAVALAASAGANAAITNSASGNGELFITIYDVGADLSSSTDDRAYVRDLGSLANGSILGGTLNNWMSATTSTQALVADKQSLSPNPIFSVAADANLQSFLSASTDTSRLLWNIVAVDSVGSDRFLTTSNTTPSVGVAAQFRNVAGSVDIYLAAMNPALTGESALYAGSAASINLFGNNVAGQAVGLNNVAGLGGNLQFWAISERNTTASPTIDINPFMANATTPMTWTLAANGDLTYGAVAAIPEPSEYALMLAGLGMLGFMARRRLGNRV
jgi:hypothetical protein